MVPLHEHFQLKQVVKLLQSTSNSVVVSWSSLPKMLQEKTQLDRSEAFQELLTHDLLLVKKRRQDEEIHSEQGQGKCPFPRLGIS